MSALLCAVSLELRRACVRACRRPIRSSVGVVAVALGIAVTLPIAHYIDNTLWRATVFPDGRHLFLVEDRLTGRVLTISARELAHLRSALTPALTVGAFATGGTTSPETDRSSRFVSWAYLDAEGLRLLGVAPQLGRFYTGTQERTGEHVVLISDELWRRNFARNPDAIGQFLKRDSAVYEIIGIMPARFRFPLDGADAWIPFPTRMVASGLTRAMQLVVRSNVSADTARDEQTLSESLRSVGVLPGDVRLVNMEAALSAPARRAAPLLAIAAMSALLLASLVVWHLTLSDTVALQTETYTRIALGASRLRAAGVFACDTAFVGVVGAVGGVVVGNLLTGLSSVERLHSSAELATGGHFCTTLVAVMFSLALICSGCGWLIVTRVSRNSDKMLYSRASAPAYQAHRQGLLFTAAHVCGATVFMTCAALAWASILKLQEVSPGFATDRLLTVSIEIPDGREKHGTSQSDVVERLLAHFKQIPGVVSVAATTNLPIQANGMRMPLAFEGCDDRMTPVELRLISDSYFATLGIPVIAGRTAIKESQAGPLPIVVNRTLAMSCWFGRSALGRRARLGKDEFSVVGVIDDVPMFGLRKPAEAEVYLPLSLRSARFVHVLLRVDGESPYRIREPLRKAVRSVNPTIEIWRVRSIEDLMLDGEAALYARARMLGTATAVALVIAALGVYSTASLTARLRRRELAIRVAVGARPLVVVACTTLRAVLWALPGIAVGQLCAYLAASSLQPHLFRTDIFEPSLYALSTVAIMFVVASATLVASLGLIRGDLLRCLRTE